MASYKYPRIVEIVDGAADDRDRQGPQARASENRLSKGGGPLARHSQRTLFMPAFSVIDLAMFLLETRERPFNIGPLVERMHDTSRRSAPHSCSILIPGSRSAGRS